MSYSNYISVLRAKHVPTAFNNWYVIQFEQKWFKYYETLFNIVLYVMKGLNRSPSDCNVDDEAYEKKRERGNSLEEE